MTNSNSISWLDRVRANAQRSAVAAMGVAAVAVACAALIAQPAGAERGTASEPICSKTMVLQYLACYAELRDDALTARAVCLNFEDEDERGECFEETGTELHEGRDLCVEQRDARSDMCEAIGEAAYDPDMAPELFQDPRNPTTTNPYYPLDIGNRAVFEDEEERIVIVVLDETKRVGEIDCLVINDKVFEDGLLVEDTDDWFGLRTNGTVEYCGEAVLDYELFEGDDPQEVQVVSIEGSFKAGTDGAKSGIGFPAKPTVGTTYRQEWDAGNAEDNGEVLSIDYGYGQDAELDEFVPQALAELMCPLNDCVVIRDFSSLEPDAFERKYYARGIGKFLEVKPDEGIAVPIVECNFDVRCDSLPVE